MPSISMFYGIVIYMYYTDHQPPHFHAFYGDYKAIFDLNGDWKEGEMPGKQKRQIKVWAELHEDELKALWKLSENGEELYRIKPLQ
ncbi:MAG: DUF4160 domain-containing protein [Treponema sp.]|nr:DUF4160 domain-containing protein [Treponema sp.]